MMAQILKDSVFFGAALSLCAYFLGVFIQKKTRLAFLNPLLISVVAVICVLVASGVDYDSYNEGAKYLSYLLTPATVALAIPLYEQFEILKKNALAILLGIGSGVVTSTVCILALSALFGFSHTEYVTFLPKSITTAIGMSVSGELGGMVPVTVTVIVMTGVFGNVIAEGALRLFRVTDPVAKGTAIGTASHAIGTSRAMQLGEVEGALSSLSIVVAGLLTVLAANLFAALY